VLLNGLFGNPKNSIASSSAMIGWAQSFWNLYTDVRFSWSRDDNSSIDYYGTNPVKLPLSLVFIEIKSILLEKGDF
jgi:hypothetical protein